MTACLRFTRRVWKSFVDNKGIISCETFETSAQHTQDTTNNAFRTSLVITRAIPGLVQTKLKIESYHLNRVGTVHGGLIMSLTDTLGSLAVASKGHFMTGVSTDISTSFVRPAGRVGTILNATASITALGKNLAYTRVDFVDEAGRLVAYGTHTKYVGKSSSDPSNVKFSEDGETVVEGVDVK